MNFLATKEAMGGFKVFDLITFACFFYFIRYFFVDNFINKQYFHLFLFVSLIVVAVIGSLLSEHPTDSLKDVSKMLPAFIFARFLLLECLQDGLFHYKIIKTLKLTFTVALVFLAVQMLAGLSFTFYPTLNINTFDPLRQAIRYPGYFNDSQAQGQFLAVGSFLFLYNPATLTEKNKRINYFLFFLCIVAVYLTGSRSAFLGLLIGLSVVVILTGKKYALFIIIASLFVTLAYKFLPAKSGVMSRTENIDEDLKFRQSIWKDALTIAEKYPFFGIGSGNYKSYTKQHNPNQYFEIDHEILYFDQPENGPLKIIVELGFTGFLLFALIILSTITSAVILFLKGQSDYKIILLVAALLSWVVAFNSVYSLFDKRLLILITTITVLMITAPKINPNRVEN